MIPLQLVMARPPSGFEAPAGPPDPSGTHAGAAWDALAATLEATVRRLAEAGAAIQIAPPGADAGRLASALLAGAASQEAGFVRLVIGAGPAPSLASGPRPTWVARLTLAPPEALTPAAPAIWHVPSEVGARPLAESERLQIAANLVAFIADLARVPDARPGLTAAFEALAPADDSRPCELLVSQARLPVRAYRDALVTRYAAKVARRWRDALGVAAAPTTAEVDALPTVGPPPISLAPAIPAVAEALATRFADPTTEPAAVSPAPPDPAPDDVHAALVAALRDLAQPALAALAAWCEGLRHELDRTLEAQGLASVEPLRRALATRLAALGPDAAPARAQADPALGRFPSRAALTAAEAALAACPPPTPGLAAFDWTWATGGAITTALALGPLSFDPALGSTAAPVAGAGPIPGGTYTIVGLAALGLGLGATLVTRALLAQRRRRAQRRASAARAAYHAAWREYLTAQARALGAEVEARLSALATRALATEHAQLQAVARALHDTATALDGEPPWPRAESRPFDRTLAIDPLRDLAAPPETDIPPPALGTPGWREHLATCTAPALQAAARRVVGDGPLLAARRDVVDRLLPTLREAFSSLADQLQRWVPAGAPAMRLWAAPAAVADAAPRGALPSGGELYHLVAWHARAPDAATSAPSAAGLEPTPAAAPDAPALPTPPAPAPPAPQGTPPEQEPT